MTLAYTASTWTAVIVGLSIFVPLIAGLWLTWFVLHSAKDDPDEQFRRAYDEQRRAENKLSKRDA